MFFPKGSTSLTQVTQRGCPKWNNKEVERPVWALSLNTDAGPSPFKPEESPTILIYT